MAETLTAIASVIAALASLGISVGVLVTLRRTKEVHQMVNSQRLAAQKYEKVLTDAMRKAGIEVPRDESLH